MSNKLLKKENISKLIDALHKEGSVFVAPKMDARQVVYALLVNGIRIGEYRADFTYQEPAKPPQTGWVHIVEDSKGYRNDLYRWKRKHVAAQYGIEIRET